FRRLLIQGNKSKLPTAFLAMCPAPFAGEKMIQHRQQESTKLAFVAIGQFQMFLADELSEKFLRQILCCVRPMALAAHVNINRVPICSAQRFQCALGSIGTGLTRSQNHTPVSSRKNAWCVL